MSRGRQHDSRSAEPSEDSADRIGAREVPRWVRPGVWCGGFFAILVLYFIVYPQILFRMAEAEVFEGWPRWAVDPLESSLVPILALAEKFPFYAKLAGIPPYAY